jgi:hypothetical protein
MPQPSEQRPIPRWALWHPELGFLTFGSYSEARVHTESDPRGCFTHQRDAERRISTKTFWVDGHEYEGSDLVIVEVEFHWTVKKDTLWITIEKGNIFEGTLQQFEECFFANANPTTIQRWCNDNGWSAKFEHLNPEQTEARIRSIQEEIRT